MCLLLVYDGEEEVPYIGWWGFSQTLIGVGGGEEGVGSNSGWIISFSWEILRKYWQNSQTEPPQQSWTPLLQFLDPPLVSNIYQDSMLTRKIWWTDRWTDKHCKSNMPLRLIWSLKHKNKIQARKVWNEVFGILGHLQYISSSKCRVMKILHSH